MEQNEDPVLVKCEENSLAPESSDCEDNPIVLKNVALDNGKDNSYVISEYNNVNSDGNLQIGSTEDNICSYIVNENELQEGHAIEMVEIEEYYIETEELQDQDDDTIIDESSVDSDNNSMATDDRVITLDNNYEEPDEDYCIPCKRGFKTAVGFKRHMRSAHPNLEEVDDPLTLQICPCCGEPLDSETHAIGDYKCESCPKLFKQQSILDRHTSIQHPKGEGYKCPECKFTSSEKGDLIDHLRSHSFKVVLCVYCKKEFTRKYHLVRHLNMSGCGGFSQKPPYGCEVCNRRFHRRDNLRVHMKTHEQGPKKPKVVYKCSHCPKEFHVMALLTVHIRSHTGERPYSCKDCSKSFASTGALKKHARMHTGEKPYQCNYCENRFAAKETLNRHLKIHTGEKPHSCQFCGKSFIQLSQLRAHIFHHTGEHAYVCKYCGRAFNRKLRLTQHVKFMHEGAKPLCCKECDKKFFRKEDLTRHSLSHTGEKPFVCDQCDKAFSVRSSLKIHKLTHKKEPPCSCEHCGRAFIRQDCLMRHMRSRHRELLEDIMVNAEKKRLQEQLLATISNKAEKDQKSIVDSVVWNEFTLTESIKELLTLLVDEESLAELGYPVTPTDKVLDAIIRKCGHEPASEENYNYIGRLRENAKLLFTAVIDDQAVKALLNNQTVDDVILHVLRLAKESS